MSDRAEKPAQPHPGLPTSVSAEDYGAAASPSPPSGPEAPSGGAPLSRVPTALQPNLSFSKRLHHFTFAWYTVTMSTSGICLLIANLPHGYHVIDWIGAIIFLVDLALFLATSLVLLARFMLYPKTFTRAATRPREALFVACFFLSVAVILSNVQRYSDLMLPVRSSAAMTHFMVAAFWVYAAVTFAYGVVQYHLLFTAPERRRLHLEGMTPAWVLPMFPIMLAGTLASGVVAGRGVAHVDRAPFLAIVLAGVAAQGLGMLISFFLFATYISRLIAWGLPTQRPGMFIAVGPPSFTCVALIGMASDGAPLVIDSLIGQGWILSGAGGVQGPLSPDLRANLIAAVRLQALLSAIFLWGLSFWFFSSAVLALAVARPARASFHLSWWSLVFPNVGFVMSTIKMGGALGSQGMLWMSTVLTIILVAVWLWISVLCVRAVVKRQIVWPGHDEDTD